MEKGFSFRTVHTYQFPLDFRELGVQVIAADVRRLALVDGSRGGGGLLPAKGAREGAGEPAPDGAAPRPHERRRDGGARAGVGGGGRGGGNGSGCRRRSDSPDDALLLREYLLKQRS